MFAGQKYRQFHGYPMDLCSTRKSVLFWKFWYQTWRCLLQIWSFFAQEYGTWIPDQHRQDTPVTFDIFASRGTDLCSSGSFLKAICRAKKSPQKFKIRLMALQTVLILRWSRHLEFSACVAFYGASKYGFEGNIGFKYRALYGPSFGNNHRWLAGPITFVCEMKQIRIAEKTERNQTVSRHLFQVSQISLDFSLFFKSHTNPLRCLAAILPVKLEPVRRRMSAISGHVKFTLMKSLCFGCPSGQLALQHVPCHR